MKGRTLESRELRIVLALGILVVVLTSLPYFFGYLMQPKGGKFLWMAFNIDDFCVYLSWTRQVADGHLLMRNLFTGDAQPAMQFNLFFALAGLLVRLTHLPPVAVLHILRMALAVVLLWAVWKLSRLFFSDARERIIAAALVAFSSGFGWMFQDIADRGYLSVDRWQPETLFFLSAYLNPLFLAGLLLIVGGLYHLILAHRTGQVGSALAAGSCLLLLGNVHTYDLVPLGLGWGIYLIALLLLREQRVWRSIGLSILAGLIALPSVLYQFHVYAADEVFRQRANTAASSAAIWAYFLAFGLVFILAVAGSWIAARKREHLILICWSAACFAASYLPFVAQQRKFIMGVQIPLVMLAVTAFSRLLARRSWRDWGALALLLVVFTFIMNGVFIKRDIAWLGQGKTAPGVRPYIAADEWRTISWLRNSMTEADTLLCAPDPAVFVPAFAGRRVYAGHWSETPDFDSRVKEWFTFIDPATPDQWRRRMLQETGITYVWYYDARVLGGPIGPRSLPDLDGRPFLKAVHRDGPVTVYQVVR